MFGDREIQQIKSRRLTKEGVLKQIHFFEQGAPFTKLLQAATIGNGILNLQDKLDFYVTHFREKKNEKNLVKFVPASGAATRMFKFLYAFLNGEKEASITHFFNHIALFPFYSEALEKVKELYPNYYTFDENEKNKCFVSTIISENGLNFGQYPKGLLPFHINGNEGKTAFEEHLYEGAKYAKSKNKSSIHFTVSEKHLNSFRDTLDNIVERISKETATNFDISFSHQHSQTDTIAVNEDNTPFVDENGKLVFRPGGHGALIENLNAIDADIIFIKNIDNVIVSEYLEEIALQKELLAGKLLSVQEQLFYFLEGFEKEVNEKLVEDAETFLCKELNGDKDLFKGYELKEKADKIVAYMNRPIRVCGMVKNEGEPGGGPFWVTNDNGEKSLQIVESAQIDKNNSFQTAILNNATHFNPVDLVCGVKNYKGEKFNLLDFVDSEAIFISHKTKNGKPLKALELPGLWNGAMANWNTIFVEVPLITFNPVKTVNDLLKEPHQGKK